MSSLPPSGWYDDPERPSQLRYWDGSLWTEHRAPRPDAAVATGRLSDVGSWLEGIFRHLWARRIPILVLIGIATVAWMVTAATIGWSVDGMVYTDDDGWTGVDGGRLGIAGGAFAANLVVSIVVYLAVAHQMFWSRVGEAPATAASLIAGLRGLPRLIGWSIVITLAALLAVFVVALVTVASAPAGLLLIIAAVPAAVWAYVKFAFVVVAAVEPVPGVGALRSSAAVSTSGGFWPVLGRLVLVAIAAGVVSFGLGLPFSAIGGSGDDFDEAFVVDGDVVERVDVGAVADAAGYEFGLLSLLSSIPQTISPIIAVAGIATLFAEVHGRPRR